MSSNNQEQEDFEKNAKNNAENIQNAAEAAIASGNVYAAAAGAAVKAGDKLTGGKVSEGLGKATAKATDKVPGGRTLQDASNKLNESGLGDKVGKAAAIKNGALGDSDAGAALKKAKENNSTKKQNIRPQSTKKELNVNVQLPSLENEEKEEEEKKEQAKLEGSGSFFKTVVKTIVVFSSLGLCGLLLLFVPFLVLFNIASFDDGFGISSSTGGNTGGVEYTTSDKERDAFHKRVQEVNVEYMSKNKYIEPLAIAGFYFVLNDNGADISYKKMTTKLIRNISDLMLDDTGYYNENIFRENLINTLLPKYFKKAPSAKLEAIAADIFEYMDTYRQIVGDDTNTTCSTSGSCEYNISGFYYPSRRANLRRNIQVKDLKVRLMECGEPYGSGSYLKAINQPLVDFESYVMGVVYAEIGTSYPVEAVKAQMVMARSFALARPNGLNNKAGKKLEKENGQWILQISSCVADQVFCNIDAGCSYDCSGSQSQGGICRSGILQGSCKTRKPLAKDHRLRTLGSETAGEVLVNSQGNIIGTSFNSTVQKKIKALAEQGYDYRQILLTIYPDAKGIDKANCGTGSAICGNVSSGNYTSWKQKDKKWGDVRLGQSNHTISSAGCLVTSVAMLIAKSGVPTNVTGEFNPGSFVQALNKNNGFSGANFAWYSVTKVAPRFTPVGINYSLKGLSREEKLNTIKSLLSAGYYVVAEVKGNTGEHWVAIDNVNGNVINMLDPGSNSTNLWAQYNWQNTSLVSYFKVS